MEPPHIKAINADKATREEMRSWVSSTARTLATVLHGAPSLASLKEVMRCIGHNSLSEVIAAGSMDTLKKAVVSLMEQAVKHGVPIVGEGVEPPTPPPTPPPTLFIADEMEELRARVTVFDPIDTEDDASRLASEATDLARRAAAAAAAAAKAASVPRPAAAAGMTAIDKERLDNVERLANSTAASLRDESAKLRAMEDKLAPLAAVLDAITASSAASAPALPPAAVAAVKAAVTGDRLLSEVLPFFTPGLPQGNQIPCVASPPSFGKTFMSDEISRIYDGSFFHPFKDSLDEIDSLVGTLMPRSDGTFAVIDGPLVSAARLASTGVNVLFVGDEIFNASKKTLEWMQSFLSPRLVPYLGADGVETLRRCFVIQTKHSLEDGTFEVIKAPEENLHFLFLGNLRTNPPEALMSRCRLMRFDYDPAWAADTAYERLNGYSGGLFSGPDTKAWSLAWAKAMTASREAYSRMEVSRPLCFRFLIGAVTHVSRQPGANLGMLTEYVAKWAPHQIAVQNAATQDTDPTSREAVGKIIKAAFSM